MYPHLFPHYILYIGLVTCSEPKALRLGAIHFLVKFSSFQSNRHGPSFLGDRIVEFIPVRLLKKSTTTLENWEIALLDAARKLASSLGLLDVDNNSESEADGESGGGKGIIAINWICSDTIMFIF
jgi:hypothetical protein